MASGDVIKKKLDEEKNGKERMKKKGRKKEKMKGWKRLQMRGGGIEIFFSSVVCLVLRSMETYKMSLTP